MRVAHLSFHVSRKELSFLGLFALPSRGQTLLVLFLISLEFSAKSITSLGDNPLRSWTFPLIIKHHLTGL